MRHLHILKKLDRFGFTIKTNEEGVYFVENEKIRIEWSCQFDTVQHITVVSPELPPIKFNYLSPALDLLEKLTKRKRQ